MQRPTLSFTLGVSLFVVLLSLASAQAASDHLKCYKVKDPLRLTGPNPAWLNAISTQFEDEACKIVGGFRLFCTPAEKEFLDGPIQRKLVPGQSFADFTPTPLTDGEVITQDKICYKISCPPRLQETFGYTLPPAAVEVTDQFHTRTIQKLKPFVFCGPAVKGTEFCGDNAVNGDEECDGTDDAACVGACQLNCTCPEDCSTACCYMENISTVETSCVEYTGRAAQVAAFSGTCSGSSLPVGTAVHTAGPGPCVLGPLFGVPCSTGLVNHVVAPKDSSCP